MAEVVQAAVATGWCWCYISILFVSFVSLVTFKLKIFPDIIICHRIQRRRRRLRWSSTWRREGLAGALSEACLVVNRYRCPSAEEVRAGCFLSVRVFFVFNEESFVLRVIRASEGG